MLALTKRTGEVRDLRLSEISMCSLSRSLRDMHETCLLCSLKFGALSWRGTCALSSRCTVEGVSSRGCTARDAGIDLQREELVIVPHVVRMNLEMN